MPDIPVVVVGDTNTEVTDIMFSEIVFISVEDDEKTLVDKLGYPLPRECVLLLSNFK